MAFIFYLLSSSLGNCECALVRGVSGVSDRAILPHQASSQYPKGTMEPLRPLFFPKMEACNPITLSWLTAWTAPPGHYLSLQSAGVDWIPNHINLQALNVVLKMRVGNRSPLNACEAIPLHIWWVFFFPALNTRDQDMVVCCECGNT